MIRSRKSAAFTLVEVLATIVFVAIVLPVAMHGISVATSIAGLARHRAEAAVLAQSKLNELIATREWQNGLLSGEFDEDHPGYKWTVEIKDWDTSSLKELDLTVSWNAGGREQRATLSTLVEPGAN